MRNYGSCSIYIAKHPSLVKIKPLVRFPELRNMPSYSNGDLGQRHPLNCIAYARNSRKSRDLESSLPIEVPRVASTRIRRSWIARTRRRTSHKALRPLIRLIATCWPRRRRRRTESGVWSGLWEWRCAWWRWRLMRRWRLAIG
jgi:hypothetical protein